MTTYWVRQLTIVVVKSNSSPAKTGLPQSSRARPLLVHCFLWDSIALLATRQIGLRCLLDRDSNFFMSGLNESDEGINDGLMGEEAASSWVSVSEVPKLRFGAV